MSDTIIRLSGVGKMYKVFASRRENLLDAVGLGRFMPWRRIQPREFWAVRGIDLELARGQRLGVIGRNGAGKTTLLKLLTGNLAPTEGDLKIDGKVHPLLDMGAGFHPELTGHENIRATLTYQGLSPADIKDAEADIADFTELGAFLNQPIKTYSLGMQARLAFATATTVKPDILIIDEVLGAGDAYFLAKSSERMRALVESGASVIIVSHILDYVTRFCESAVWLERGRVLCRGASLDVVKAYQQFIQVLEDRRLRSKNRKMRSAGRYDPTEYDNYAESVRVRLILSGAKDAWCDVALLQLWKGDEIEEALRVGDAQDADASQSAFVLTGGGGWSPPRQAEGGYCRRLLVAAGGDPPASGSVLFNLFTLFDDFDYALQVRYRVAGRAALSLEVRRGDLLHLRADLPVGEDDWITQRIPLGHFPPRAARTLPRDAGRPHFDEAMRAAASPARAEGRPGAGRGSRWPGEGSLAIDEVKLLGPDGRERAVFHVGAPLTLRVRFTARKSGTFDVVPAATLYRLDGILVSNHPGPGGSLSLEAGEEREAFLHLGPLNLGNGNYVFSVALYRELAYPGPSEAYDLIDRSYEFQVVGNGPFANGVFRHPGHWQLD